MNDQIKLDDFINSDRKGKIIKDIVHKNREIYIDKRMPWCNNPKWMHRDAWPKIMKNKEVVYHQYDGKRPSKSKNNLVDQKRRLLFSIMLNSGNPTWETASDFIEWLEKYNEADTIEKVKELVCNKYCFKCKKNKRKNDDIGKGSVELFTSGYND